ncbi:hypothetical protein Tco_1581299 [Tanacetum coccineum]
MDSSSSSSLETLSDSPSDDLSNSLSSHSSSDHSSLALTSETSYSFVTGPTRKRNRSPTTPVPIPSPIPGALSSPRVDLLPLPKRIRSSYFVTDLEGCLDENSESSIPKETSLRDDVVVKGSDEPYLEHDIDLEIQVEIDECIAYADALRARGIDAMVVVEVVDREEIETGTISLIEIRVKRVTHHAVPDDILEPDQEEGAV